MNVSGFSKAYIGGALLSGLLFIAGCTSTTEKSPVARTADEDGTILVPGYALPLSSLLSDGTREILRDTLQAVFPPDCPDYVYPAMQPEQALRNRECLRGLFEFVLADMNSRYAVDVRSEVIDGVYTETITPADGVPEEHADIILLHMDGSGFETLIRGQGQYEAIPVAAMGGFRIIDVEYTRYPEGKHPDGVTDAIKVYRHLLETYQPEKIGIFGCSAGAVLTAQMIAALPEADLPMPGAAAMLCLGAGLVGGDTYNILSPVEGANISSPGQVAYFEGADTEGPLASPVLYPEILAKFPPSLIMSGIRDRGLSLAVFTHSELTKVGVPAELHVWEGLGHAGWRDPRLEEFEAANTVIARFFDKNL